LKLFFRRQGEVRPIRVGHAVSQLRSLISRPETLVAYYRGD